MQKQLERMWASKIGLRSDQQGLVRELLQLMAMSGWISQAVSPAFRRAQTTSVPSRAVFCSAEFKDDLDEVGQLVAALENTLNSSGGLREAAAAMQRLNPAILAGMVGRPCL